MMNRIIENQKLSGEISAITSKSYAHRAILASLLSNGNSTIIIDNLSKDIEASLRSITSLGASINRSGNKFHIIPPKKFKSPVTLNVGESGTTLRLIIPIIATLGLDAKIVREGSLIGRTNSIYFDLLPKHGVEIYEDGDAIYLSGKLVDFNFKIPGNVSSQFISGLMLASGASDKDFKIGITTELESRPYIDITTHVLQKFGLEIIEDGKTFLCKNTFVATEYVVERDWSNALFFLAAGVKVKGLNKNSKQGDKKALEFLKKLGFQNISKDEYQLKKINSAEDMRILDARDIPDTVPILCVISALAYGCTEIINIKRLRLKESDRVKSTVEMLENLGVKVDLCEDSFSFDGIDTFKSTKINSHNDHRIAMASAIAATFADGPVEIIDSECVEKSYTDFYKDFESLGGAINVL
ncbi:3-phosphoshikimate 1-carboxyvinyltransferase [Peptoniphilus sp.]|jgi:3-phosphoshikimate 1-carboxyvinyltransferase|uniref:3-phosphoshikimate 1-carboxyvinyltransferase n=1 Tax=Peptoniphilus sp. TaxID=1971214 RepID=UPI003D921732